MRVAMAKIAKADATFDTSGFPGGSLAGWFETVTDTFVTFRRKDCRNARDRARRAQRRKAVHRA
jgi:hypothetical protein